ncbi:class I SAM-dependent methyltransferase [Pseudonocardia thermophila]|nr:class I SAM-dependent methyltransferase [Pseudonocardia thermophila]
MSADREFWDERWSLALHAPGQALTRRPPHAYLTEAVRDLPPGRALDAGCGDGADALWLAARGWRVTALDFSPAALTHARANADAAGPAVAARVSWLEADLRTWQPPAGAFDLVICLYVQVAGSTPDVLARIASGVAPGGTLLVVGHHALGTADERPQASVADAVTTLDPREWELVVAEDRLRANGTGLDAVINARRTA